MKILLTILFSLAAFAGFSQAQPGTQFRTVVIPVSAISENDDIIQRKGGYWMPRSMAELLADLGIVPGGFDTSTIYQNINRKSDSNHTHVISYVLGLPEALDAKANIVGQAFSGAVSFADAIATASIAATSMTLSSSIPSTTNSTRAATTAFVRTREAGIQGQIDGFASNLAIKLNISDTAAMFAAHPGGGNDSVFFSNSFTGEGSEASPIELDSATLKANIWPALNARTVAINTHSARTDNPHSVTKTQVGLGSVVNVDTATQGGVYQTAINLLRSQAIKYTDSATMLANYRTGLNVLTAATALKLNISDTSVWGTSYQNAINARIRWTDSASLHTVLWNTINTRATVTNLALKSNSASPTFTGTVVLPSTTSIGTITNTELSYVDGVTSAIQTQFTGKLNISDTAAMHTAYQNGLNARTVAIALKVNISDTSTMLTAYRNGLNAGTVANALKMNIADTSAMLTAYRNAINSNTALKLNISDTAAMFAAHPSSIQNSTTKAMIAMGSPIKAWTVGMPYMPFSTYAADPMTNSAMWITAVYLDAPATITGAKVFLGLQGAYTASNYNGIGLYSVSGGTLTLVASSTNDGNIWKAASTTIVSKAFTSPYVAAAGVYYVATMYNRSAETTAPKLTALGTSFLADLNSSNFTNSLFIQGVFTSGAALPSTITASAVSSAYANPIVVYIY